MVDKTSALIIALSTEETVSKSERPITIRNMERNINISYIKKVF
jgi:hypothetical protein